jgi:hypothetical protein
MSKDVDVVYMMLLQGKVQRLEAENARLRLAITEAKGRLSRGQPDRSEQSHEALLILSLALIAKGSDHE